MNEPKSQITYEEYSKVDVRMGTIVEAEKVTGSEKLIKMQVDFGDFGKRQILAGISKWYKPEDLVNKQTSFVVNLPPRKMMGLESQGMLFAIFTKDEGCALLHPDQELEGGEILS